MHHLSESEAGSEGSSDDNAEDTFVRTMRRTTNLASWKALTTRTEPKRSAG
jgi:hypothetical protein